MTLPGVAPPPKKAKMGSHGSSKPSQPLIWGCLWPSEGILPSDTPSSGTPGDPEEQASRTGGPRGYCQGGRDTRRTQGGGEQLGPSSWPIQILWCPPAFRAGAGYWA